MTLFIASLNSGSNGNCYYVGNDAEAVLIDAGLSCRETEKRMRRLGLPLDRVKAIFVSHEHDDHTKGVEVLSQRYRLPVYVTTRTLEQCRFYPDAELARPFDAASPITIGALTVTAFAKTHDACDPYSFTVASSTVRIGIFTDLGHVCDNLILHFSQCHAAFLEANYDEQLLENGRYPWPLKNPHPRRSGPSFQPPGRRAFRRLQAAVHEPPAPRTSFGGQQPAAPGPVAIRSSRAGHQHHHRPA